MQANQMGSTEHIPETSALPDRERDDAVPESFEKRGEASVQSGVEPEKKARPNGSRPSSAQGFTVDSKLTTLAGQSQALLPPRVTGRRVKIDREVLERAGILTPQAGRYRLAEELRVIKRRLLNNASGLGEIAGDYSNVILVTSAGPGEGKTFLAANLAVSIELEIDRTVLLVDCDTIKAGLSRLFGLESQPGLADLLSRQDLSLPDVFYRTDLDDLAIIPAGSRLPHINERMASLRMQHIMKDLATRYEDRIIVLDTPPLLATTETSVLARLVGQVVIVVAAGQTEQTDLLAAIDQLDPSKITGLVLNKSAERAETAYHESYLGFDRKLLEG